MRAAIIGLGEIARKAYLPILTEIPDLDIILSSRSEASISQIQAQAHIQRGTTSLAEVLQYHPQVAFVLTPKETHFEIACQLLGAGVDVYIEKPATTSADQTRQLAELADRHRRVLMVGYNRRFAPLHVKARELMAGWPVSLGLFQKERSNTSVTSLEEQFLEDTIHQIDLLRFYCGEGEVVSTIQQTEEGNFISAVSTIALDNGGIATLATSLRAGGWNEAYSLFGSDQSIFIDAFAKLRLVTPQEEKIWQEPYASSWKTTLSGRGFTGQIDHFLDCVQRRNQPQTSAWDSVKTQQLQEQIVKAVKLDR
jgi:virulence factor